MAHQLLAGSDLKKSEGMSIAPTPGQGSSVGPIAIPPSGNLSRISRTTAAMCPAWTGLDGVVTVLSTRVGETVLTTSNPVHGAATVECHPAPGHAVAPAGQPGTQEAP